MDKRGEQGKTSRNLIPSDGRMLRNRTHRNEISRVKRGKQK